MNHAKTARVLTFVHAVIGFVCVVGLLVALVAAGGLSADNLPHRILFIFIACLAFYAPMCGAEERFFLGDLLVKRPVLTVIGVQGRAFYMLYVLWALGVNKDVFNATVVAHDSYYVGGIGIALYVLPIAILYAIQAALDYIAGTSRAR